MKRAPMPPLPPQRGLLWTAGLGALGTLAASLLPGLEPVAIAVALAALGIVVWRAYWQVAEMSDVVANTQAAAGKVQPEGPGFQEVLRALPDPVMVVSGREPGDIAGRWIVYANTAARSRFRISSDEGLLVSALRYPEVLEAVDAALFGEGCTLKFDVSGAQTQHWSAFTSPLPATMGTQTDVRLALLVLRDETEARRAEKMRADFLANASHELRSPLTSLTGFIETLRGPAKEDETARERFLSIMSSQAERMGRLIHDLMSLSRIEMNEHIPPSGEVDLCLCVHDVVDGLSLIASEKKVALHIDRPKGGCVIPGDRDQVLQVLQNLIDNALKYAPAGTDVNIEIESDLSFKEALRAREDSPKLILLRPDLTADMPYCRVRVRDAGAGIRREYLPRLAERFYRVEGQKSGSRLGTGLGLAIVKHILNRHRGGLMVESLAREEISPETPPLKAAATSQPPSSFTAFTACFPLKEG